MRTPQSIKDQEFQSKFRGFDPIEVKAYLDELADDLFELYEEKRRIEDELQDSKQRADAAESECETHRKALADSQSSAGEIEKKVEQGYQYKDEKIAELNSQLAESKVAFDEQSSALLALESELSSLQKSLNSQEDGAAEVRREREKWQTKCTLLEEQLQEAQKEDFDFKTTLVAAQKFAQELKATAQSDAKLILSEAEKEVEEMRASAASEKQRLESEIAGMARRESSLRFEFREKLESTLAAIAIFQEHDLESSVDEKIDLDNIELSLTDVTMGHE